MTQEHQAAAPAAGPREAQGPLRQLAVRGGLWVLGGHAASQALRLGGNLVLTRLLFPEAFGLMALVQIALQGTQMLSDVGLRGSVVQNPRGRDPVFLDTAWTLQVLRGLGLWLVVILMAWPMASLYGQPPLLTLLPVAGATALLRGFQSTARLSLLREIRPARVVAMEFAAQLLGLVAMVAWALVHRSVWALVVGALVNAAAQAALSHRLLHGYSNRFRFEREAVRSIFEFGRWIFVSTAMTFLLTQGDRLVLGKLLSASELGVYSIAFFLSQTMLQAVQLMAGKVLFPLYARMQHRELADLRRGIARSRAVVLSFALPPLWGLALLGPELVRLLYDPRYHEAGWMLQILAIGMIGGVVTVTAERILLARGDSFRHMLLQASYAGLLIGGMALGGWMEGLRGLLYGVSGARLLSYVPMAILIRRYGTWQPGLDGLALGASAGVLAAGYAIRWTL